MYAILVFAFFNISVISALSPESQEKNGAILSDDKPMVGRRLDLRITLIGDDSCSFAFTKMKEILSIISESIVIEGDPLSVSSITNYKLSGCSNHTGPAVSITVGIPTTSVEKRGISPDDFFDMATESIKASTDDMFRKLVSTCGCKIRLSSINLDLTHFEIVSPKNAMTASTKSPLTIPNSGSKLISRSKRDSRKKRKRRNKKKGLKKSKKDNKILLRVRPRRNGNKQSG
jgi:hypothetical protein